MGIDDAEDRDHRLPYIVAKTFLDAGNLYPSQPEVAMRWGQVGHMLACLDSLAKHGPMPILKSDEEAHAEDCLYLFASVYDEDTQTRVRLPCSCPAAYEETDATPQA